jgi:quinol monooxygenase YgiN
MNSRFNVLARYRTKPGSTEAVLNHLKEMAIESRTELGNLSYEFFRGVEDESELVILESYLSYEDFETHHQTQHFLSIGAGNIMPELESRTVATFVTEDVPSEVP